MDGEIRFDVAILLATRKRTQALSNAVKSIVDKAEDKRRIQIILAFDEDDDVGLPYFLEHIKPWLRDQGVNTKHIVTERYGYSCLNRYYNLMANMAEAHWVMMWNDDAIMDTQGWDRVVASYNNQFKVLRVHANNDHPFAIFPIVPRLWIRMTGQMSRFQEVDHETSHIAYLIDVMETIPVWCTHDRAVLTGNNEDETYQQRIYYNHDPKNPNSFYYPKYRDMRFRDADVLTMYLKSRGHDASWWEDIKAGKNKTPFAKLVMNDPNRQSQAANMPEYAEFVVKQPDSTQ
jgi:hypothetical protein